MLQKPEIQPNTLGADDRGARTLTLRRVHSDSPGAEFIAYDVIHDDGHVRHRVGSIVKDGHQGWDQPPNPRPWIWGIMSQPGQRDEDRGESATREDAMTAFRERWNRMSDDWKRMRVFSFCGAPID